MLKMKLSKEEKSNLSLAHAHFFCEAEDILAQTHKTLEEMRAGTKKATPSVTNTVAILSYGCSELAKGHMLDAALNGGIVNDSGLPRSIAGRELVRERAEETREKMPIHLRRLGKSVLRNAFGRKQVAKAAFVDLPLAFARSVSLFPKEHTKLAVKLAADTVPAVIKNKLG